MIPPVVVPAHDAPGPVLRVEHHPAPLGWCVVHEPSGVILAMTLPSHPEALQARAVLAALPILWDMLPSNPAGHHGMLLGLSPAVTYLSTGQLTRLARRAHDEQQDQP